MPSSEQSQPPRAAAPVPGASHTPQTGQERPVAGDDGPAVARARRPPTIEDEFLTVAEIAAIPRSRD